MSPYSNRRILAIDDNPAIHEDYRKVLAASHAEDDLSDMESLLFGEGETSRSCQRDSGFEIDSAFQGREGFELVKQALAENRPYATAFIDVRMPPGWDGIETAQRIWEIAPGLPVVLCTAYSDHSWTEISEKLNRTDQLLILKKPFDNIELRQMAASQTEKWRLGKLANIRCEELEALVQERTRDFLTTRDMMFYTLARLAESRDAETGAHLDRMQQYTKALATWLRDNGPYRDQIDDQFVEDIFSSSVLHDMGKVATPDKILLKPGPLTPDEFEVMKQHATIGADALDEAASLADCCRFLKMSAEIARYHHEKFNGEGYPCGLSGTDIPLSARIVAVADVYDALTSDRVYRPAIDALDAKEMINEESGRHFDPAIVEAFNACWNQIIQIKQASQSNLDRKFLPTTFPATSSQPPTPPLANQ